MDLYERENFESFVLSLPATQIVRQWGDASVGKVGGKIFAIHGLGADNLVPRISFKCSDMAFELLPELEDIIPAPYLARAKWVAAGPGAPLTADELVAYLTEAHRLIAMRLTGKQKDKYGLRDYLATR